MAKQKTHLRWVFCFSNRLKTIYLQFAANAVDEAEYPEYPFESTHQYAFPFSAAPNFATIE